MWVSEQKEDVMSEFSQLLSQYIHSKDIKTYALAQYCGLDRSNMYKIINGKRKPASEEMVDKMCKFMHLSPVEESALKEAYNITLVGSDNYYRRKDVLHFFEDFSLSSVSIPVAGYSSELDSPFDGVILLNTPAEINRALLYILSTELQKETGYISMLIQPDYDYLINILAAEGHYKSGVNIDHLICINNNSESAFIASHKNYNLQCLKQILPLYGNNYKYNCFYYYDNILSMDSSMTLFPYIIITSGYACLLTSDYQKGYLSHDRETIRMFTDIFKEHLKKASPLLHRIDSPFMQLEYVQSLFCGSTRSCFFQMTPCFTPFITLEMMEKCISKDMPHRREFIDSFHSYVKNLLQSYEHSDVSLIFSLDGVIRFLETGKVGEYPPEVYIPFERADRIYLLRQLLQACRTQNYRMLKENVGSLDNELYLSVNQKRGYLMFSAPVHKKLIYLDIEEPDLLFTFLDFCENLDADMFYTKEETIRKLRDLIETA